MSLIFQSLQKLDEHQETPPQGIGDPVDGKTGARSRPIRWLLPVTIGLVLSLALGSGAVYAVQYLKERLPDQIRPSDRYDREDRNTRPEITSPIKETAKRDVERAVDPSPVETQVEPVNAPAAVRQYEFHPPAPESAPKELPPAAKVEAKGPQPAKAVAADASSPVALPVPEPETVTASKPDDAVAPTAPPAVDVELESMERARRAALAKSARIGRLVRQIEQALAGSREAGDAKILLEKLARLKGENHPYVAKLRAYYNFQRGNMELAEADLYKVIAVRPDDLEAGINLALIEIHGQRYEKALSRLKLLRQVYPEDERIADLVKRLQ